VSPLAYRDLAEQYTALLSAYCELADRHLDLCRRHLAVGEGRGEERPLPLAPGARDREG